MLGPFGNPRVGQTPLEPPLGADAEADNTPAARLPLQHLHLNAIRSLSIETSEELLGYMETPEIDLRSLKGLGRLSDQRVEEIRKTLKKTSSKKIIGRFGRVAKEEYAYGAMLSPLKRASGRRTPLSSFDEAPQKFAIVPKADTLPIKHQGNRGTCVAFATCAAAELACAAAGATPCDFSEQFQFWLCKRNDFRPDSDGTWPTVSFALVASHGVCDEVEWPYSGKALEGNVSHDPPGPPARLIARPPKAKFWRLIATELRNPRHIITLKKWILNGHAIAIAIPAFKSWTKNPYTRITGIMPLPLRNEQPEGGHAVALTGFVDDASFAGGGYFVMRNSWGTKWAEDCVAGAGHGLIPYKFVEYFNRSAHVVQSRNPVDTGRHN